MKTKHKKMTTKRKRNENEITGECPRTISTTSRTSSISSMCRISKHKQKEKTGEFHAHVMRSKRRFGSSAKMRRMVVGGLNVAPVASRGHSSCSAAPVS